MAKLKGRLPGAVVGRVAGGAARLPRRVALGGGLVLAGLAAAGLVWWLGDGSNDKDAAYDTAAAEQTVETARQRTSNANVTLAELAQDPNVRATNYSLAAGNYLAAGDKDLALEYSKQAVAAGATDAAVVRQVTYQYGVIVAGSGDYAAALTALRPLVKSSYGDDEKQFQTVLADTINAYEANRPYVTGEECEPTLDKECS